MNKLSEKAKIVFRDVDTGSTTNTVAGFSTAWLDMKDYHSVMFLIFRTVGTGRVTSASIKASAASTGTSSATVGTALGTTDATGSLVDATAGKTGTTGCGVVVLEANHDEIAAAVADARYIAPHITQAAAGDEFGCVAIRWAARYGEANLTTSDSG